jgi:hypothetical protein
MIDNAPTKVYRACLFVDGEGGTPSESMLNEAEAYSYIEPMLLQFVARFDFERNVYPFQLRYRPFNLFLCDIGGWKDGAARQGFMESLGDVIKGRLSRVYLFWTGETFEEFCAANPDLRDYETCVNVCSIDWMEKVEKCLQKQDE